MFETTETLDYTEGRMNKKNIDNLFKDTQQAGLSVSRNATCWVI